MRSAQLLQREGENPVDIEDRAACSDSADAVERELTGGADFGEALLVADRHGDDRPPGGLAEQRHERIAARDGIRKRDAGTEAEAQAHLRQRQGQATVGDVVGRRQQPLARTGDENRCEGGFALQVDRRRSAAQVAMDDPGPGRSVEFVGGFAEQVDRRRPRH